MHSTPVQSWTAPNRGRNYFHVLEVRILFVSQCGVGILMSLTHVQPVIHDDPEFLVEGLPCSVTLRDPILCTFTENQATLWQ